MWETNLEGVEVSAGAELEVTSEEVVKALRILGKNQGAYVRGATICFEHKLHGGMETQTPDSGRKRKKTQRASSGKKRKTPKKEEEVQ